MTIVVAKKFGERIVVASDTMLSDRGATKENAIPGALKSLVIDLNCSVALAGNYVRGLYLVRSLRKTYLRNRDFDQLLESLRSDSEDGECDYIVSMHRPHAELRKVWEGKISVPLLEAWCGSSEVASTVFALPPIPAPAGASQNQTPEEIASTQFQLAVQNLALHRTAMGDGVGGFIITQIGTPFGHTYNDYSGAVGWNVPIGSGLQDEINRARATGENSYGYAIVAPAARGIPLVGAYIQQARAGFVYSPLEEDQPRSLSMATQIEMNRILSDDAAKLGGVCTNDWDRPAQDFDAIARNHQGDSGAQ